MTGMREIARALRNWSASTANAANFVSTVMQSENMEAQALLLEQAASAIDSLSSQVAELREALKPFSNITVEGLDHEAFGDRFPELAAKVANARRALASEQTGG